MALPSFVQQPTIAIADLRTDGATQARAYMDGATIDEYAEAMNAGSTFPPVVVFNDGSDYWLADGFHRVEAATLVMDSELPADIRMGTRRDAILYAVGANADHGLRRTNEDKRRSVARLLEDDEWAKWSDREIARRCAVSNQFVSNMRKSICQPLTDSNERTVQRGGVTYTQNTANIGNGAQDTAGPGESLTEHSPDPEPDAAPPVGRGKCKICGKPITDPASLDRGMGDVCAAHAARDAGIEDAKTNGTDTPTQAQTFDSGVVVDVRTASEQIIAINNFLAEFYPEYYNDPGLGHLDTAGTVIHILSE